VLPFYWRHKTDAADGGLLFPYLWYDTKEAHRQAVLPLWYRSQEADSRLSLLFPLYYSLEKGDSSQQIIFPLWYQSRAPDASTSLLVPFWLSHQRKEARFRTVFPLYWQRRDADSRLRLLVPLHGRHSGPETETSVWLPIYFHHQDREARSDLVYYFPVYGRYTLREHATRQLFLFPLYAQFVDIEQDHRSWNVLWPLFHYETAPEFYHTRALPFYWHTRRPEHEFSLGSLALPPPCYLRDETPERSLRHLWPFFGKTRQGSYEEVSSLWPLLRWGEDPEGQRRSRQFLLIYSHQQGEVHSAGFFPLWHRRQEPGKMKTLSLLHWNEKEEARDVSRFAVLHLGDPDYSMFSHQRDGGKSRQHLFPLYSFARDEEKQSRRLSIVGPIFTHRWSPEHSRTRLLWKTLYFEHAPDKKESGLLWRLVRSYRDPSREIFEFNPFYYQEKNAEGEEYRSWLGGGRHPPVWRGERGESAALGAEVVITGRRGPFRLRPDAFEEASGQNALSGHGLSSCPLIIFKSGVFTVKSAAGMEIEC
jgi:hypothetical protein